MNFLCNFDSCFPLCDYNIDMKEEDSVQLLSPAPVCDGTKGFSFLSTHALTWSYLIAKLTLPCRRYVLEVLACFRQNVQFCSSSLHHIQCALCRYRAQPKHDKYCQLCPEKERGSWGLACAWIMMHFHGESRLRQSQPKIKFCYAALLSISRLLLISTFEDIHTYSYLE